MNLIHALHRLKQIPLTTLPRFFLFKLKCGAARLLDRCLASYSHPYAAKTGGRRRFVKTVGLLHPDVKTLGFKEIFKNDFSKETAALLQEADNAIDLRLDLLGSGLVDLKKVAGGKIPWHFDFKTGAEWPADAFFAGIKVKNGTGSDIKVPWELSRCQHFVRLGQAYRLTGDEKYAKAFFFQLEDWIKENPPSFGVNWVCPMDVALRAANWLLAWEFFAGSPSKTEFFEQNFPESLFQHGRHIRRNLEWGADISSNHYLSDLLGLLYIGCALGQEEWAVFSKREMEKEIFRQTYSDGFDFEGSTGYHRLVLELFFFAALVLERHTESNIRFGGEFKTRLKQMFGVVNALASDDGTIPFIGDNDSGRVHVLSAQPDNDVRALSGLGSLFFKENDLKMADWGVPTESVWLFGLSGLEIWRALPGVKSEAVKSKAAGPSGVAVMRKNGILVFSAQPNGTRGVGGHTHNDKLSFTVTVGADHFLVDPGTYLYTSDPEKRNLFRSTRFHTTIEVDSHEQNRFFPGNLFVLGNDSAVTIEKDVPGEEIAARHSGYERLKDPVTHKRRIKTEPAGWLVVDDLTGRGQHDFQWSFVCGPDIQPKITQPGRFVLQGREASLDVSCSNDLAFEITEGFYAGGYGRIQPTRIVRAVLKSPVPYRVSFQIKVIKNSHPN